MHKIKILETTLRDGNYTVNDQFNAKDTAYIAKILEEIGFEYIEIGAGIGLNAKSKNTIGPASQDYEYIHCAKESVKKSKIGMFFIPGIGRIEDLDMAASKGLDFIRLGINIDAYKEVFPYIEHALRNELMVTVNLMKSYAVSSIQFAEYAQDVFKQGAQIVYLVDSAGGMLPQEVYEYINRTKNRAPHIKIGFHGHDNLSMAMANTLSAIDAGAEYVDSTLRGIGRSSGNTITEKLILILDRMGYKHAFNLDKLLKVGEEIILPYLHEKFETSTDYVLGYSQFHSSYLNAIYQASKEFSVDPNKLIVAYSEIDKIHMDEEKLKKVAQKVKLHDIKNQFEIVTNTINYTPNSQKQIEILKNNFIQTKNKYNRKIFFNIAQSYQKKTGIKISPVVHTVENIAFGSAEIHNDTKGYLKIMDKFKEVVDGYLIDKNLFKFMSDISEVKSDKIYYYDDAFLFAQSIFNYTNQIIINEKYTKIYVDVYPCVKRHLTPLLKSLEIQLAADIIDADIAIVGRTFIDESKIKACSNIKWVLLTVPGMLSAELSLKDEIQCIRIDFKREIFSEIVNKLNYHRLFHGEYGKKEIEGKMYCSGGYIGPEGSIVVDHINQISKIYGVSNGDGSIRYTSY